LLEAKRLEVNLLAGFGSYELLRGGVEVQRNNLWGRGHQDRLRIIQSMKSSNVDYLYTMPEFFGKEADVFLNSSWLDREEPSFTRQEFGGGAGVKKHFKSIQSDVVIRYLYEVLDSINADTSVGPRSADVGAAIFEFRHDRQDNPLYPRKGYKVIQRFEGASEFLGGDVNYQKVEMLGSLHHGLWEGQWMHYGIAHGVIHSAGASRTELPFGKRYFPGGDTSIRGFRQGEASPRNADGKLIGAEVYLGGNVEFEQSLTEKLSLVLLLDAMGVGAELNDYPFSDWFISVGAGLRWKTILGPVRVEYGYNLRRRIHDPKGAIHFSVGFPF
jgi:outer membrane protein insertion porin family